MNNTNTWVNKLNLDKVNLYPLQFANVYRIRKHKAVFIFDEVGTGKTISASIMALDYLENNPLKSVLIITANSLVQSNQFIND